LVDIETSGDCGSAEYRIAEARLRADLDEMSYPTVEGSLYRMLSFFGGPVTGVDGMYRDRPLTLGEED